MPHGHSAIDSLIALTALRKYQAGGEVDPTPQSEGMKGWLESNVGRKQILPVLEFLTGIPAAGERGRDVTAADLLLTAPAIGAAGVGAFKLGKEAYKRATTIPVWRGITEPVKTVAQKTAGGIEDVIMGSPLYNKMLHTSLNPKLALKYTAEDVLSGAPTKGGQLLKFRVPKKELYKKGKVGPYTDVEEIIFPSLPKSTLQYAKHPSELSLLDKADIMWHGRGKAWTPTLLRRTPRAQSIRKMIDKGLDYFPSIEGSGLPKYYTGASNLRFNPKKFRQAIDDLYAQ